MKSRPLGVLVIIILSAGGVFSGIKFLISDNLFILKIFSFVCIPIQFFCCIGLWRFKEWGRKLSIAFFVLNIFWLALWFSPFFKNTRIEYFKRAMPSILEKRAKAYDEEPRDISKTEWMARSNKISERMQSNRVGFVLFFMCSGTLVLFIFYLERIKVKEHFK